MKAALAALAGIAAATAGFLAFSASRPDPDAPATTQQVGHRTMSPFCPGLNLEECPSAQAAVLRSRIAARVAKGDTNAEIDAWLVSEYGESIAGRPGSAASWAVPLLGTAAAVAGVVAFINGRKRREPAPQGPEIDDDDRILLTEDLRRFAESTE